MVSIGPTEVFSCCLFHGIPNFNAFCKFKEQNLGATSLKSFAKNTKNTRTKNDREQTGTHWNSKKMTTLKMT